MTARATTTTRSPKDLAGLIESLDLRDAAIVGFSMGGGEVARYLARHNGDGRVSAGVFAGAVPPYLLKTDDNPEGGLAEDDIEGMKDGARSDRSGFLKGFLTNFFSANGDLLVSEERVDHAFTLSEPASDEAVVGCIDAFGRTDFRGDIAAISQPCLVIHGDADAIVPFEVSGERTADALDEQHPRRCRERPARLQRQPCRGVQPGASRLPGTVTSPEKYDVPCGVVIVTAATTT